ncbi:expressed unknown protein [Seminavis robusta]|uniref:Uncharacterized protein n=1 Tax=Seminavis robusta TaxID=568900 RepID=A0A9N8DYU7_9STRA|nr:expressed unknown protein [Seminavis robusta]|eukprot:Sro351_g123890.1 n/a (330) ;mRNA; r:24626-25615
MLPVPSRHLHQFLSKLLLVALTTVFYLLESSAFSPPKPIPTIRHASAILISSHTSTSLQSSANALFTQVLSDVDDTLKSSGGVNVAGVNLGGIDIQYERGEIYPGVAQFMLEVSMGGSSSRVNGTLEKCPPKVAILTARAEEFKAALELKQDSKIAVALRTAAEASGVQQWGLGPVLYGSVAEWIIQNKKGLRKFTNFERLLEQDPTGTILQYVYVGDTGELDQEAGETMLREYPEVVKAIFLHKVSNEPNVPVVVPPPRLINGRPIVFFRTYVGAATAALQLGLMDIEGVQRVIYSARDMLKDVPKTSEKWVDVERDIQAANRIVFQS